MVKKNKTKKAITKRRAKTKKRVPKPISFGEPVHKTKIRVIGIGGGGNSIVSEIAQKLKKASFVGANTDVGALRKLSKKMIRFQFGQNLTKGLGTGMNAELGRTAAQEEVDKIKKLLEGQDLCIIVACLGGGTGSGAAPVFAKASKDLGNLTYGIFTLPFKFEGEKKMEIARESLKKLKPQLSAFSIIPNERIFQIIDKTTPLTQALSEINKKLSESLMGLLETIYSPGLINIDFADFKTILESQGKLAYLNTTEVSGSEQGINAVRKVISNPLYPYTIKGAKGILFNISGEKDLGLADVSKISKSISDLAHSEAKIIFGISQSKKYRGKIKITLLAAGCGFRIFPRFELRKKKARRPERPSLESIPELKLEPEVKKIEVAQPPKAEDKEKVEKNKTAPPIKKKKKPVESKDKKSSSVKIEKKADSPPLAQDVSSYESKIRKSALQVRKEIEQEEQKFLLQEKKWDVPAFLRREK